MTNDALGILLMNLGSMMIDLGFVLMFIVVLLYIFLEKFDKS